MHLEVLQSESVTEQNVTSATIEKLYDLAYSNPSLGITSKLDATSNLQGTLSLYATYQDYVTYLQNKYPNLHINATTYYYRFKDKELNNICAQLFGDGIGVTTGELTAVSSFTNEFKTAVNSSTIQHLDLGGFIGVDQHFSSQTFQNISTLKTVYLKDIPRAIDLNFVRACGQVRPGDSKPTLEKLVIDGVFLNDTDAKLLQNTYTSRFLTGGTNNGSNYETIAIRRIAPKVTIELPSSNGSYYRIGDYLTRSINITNFYLGEPNPERVQLTQGYGDSINRIVNFYVPIGCATAYANSSTWGALRSSEFLEYDFDNDPNGIFTH